MQKRGQIAVFLVVLFIAVIGLFAIASGPGTTGLGFWGAPAKNLAGSCGDVCLRDSDCAGGCESCSPSWRIYQNRLNKCNRAHMWCLIGARNDYGTRKCGYDLEKCLSSVEVFHVPEGKTSLFE